MKVAEGNGRKRPNNITKGIIVASFMIIVGPIIIHFLFKQQGPQWLKAEWGAGDAISYYGVLLASVITIYGLFLTFKDNRRGIEEQSRLDKLPFIGMNTFDVSYRIPYLNPENDDVMDIKSSAFQSMRSKDEYYYSESKLENVFFIIRDGNISINRRLTENQLDMVKHQGVIQETIAHGVYAAVDHNLIYHPLEIENIGNGAAIDFRLGFNKLTDNCPKNDFMYIPPMPLKVGQKIYLAIYAENDKDENCGEYVIEFYYTDIFGNNYKQKHDYSIKRDEKGRLFSELYCGHKQERIDKNSVPYV